MSTTIDRKRAPKAAGHNLSPAAVRAFERIAEAWGLTVPERETLLDLSRSTYYRVRMHPEGAALSETTLDRISYVLGIYKALHILYTDDAYADRWIERPNAWCGGRPAKDLIVSGKIEALINLRRYLDAERG